MMNVTALWWLLLPVVLLPFWWHRQRRHNPKILTLATAKFLASATPQLKPIWRWRDWILLLLRCLILLCMLALLAGWFLSWRGDTVLLAPDLDPQWVQQELKKSGMQEAQQSVFCAQATCEIHTDNLLSWLEQQQAQWRPQAKILILARADQLRMNAQAPQIAHTLQIRIAPNTRHPAVATNRSKLHIAIASDRLPEWQRLISAFNLATNSATKTDQEWIVSEKVTPDTVLAIWDRAEPPESGWRAPLMWFITEAKGNVEQADAASQRLRALAIHSSQQANMQVWQIDLRRANPLQNIEVAKQLFEAWQAARPQPLSFAMQNQDRNAVPASTLRRIDHTNLEPAWQQLLLAALVILFVLERSFAHARRA